MNIASIDLLASLGDSITNGFGGSLPLQTGYFTGIRAAYGAPQCPPSGATFVPSAPRWPKNVWSNGAAGRKTIDIAGSMSTLMAPYQPATKVFIELLTNDAGNIALGAGGTPPNQTANNTGSISTDAGLASLAIVDWFHTNWGIPYSSICWIGPVLFPTIVAAVNLVCANAIANAALRGYQFIDCRGVNYPNSSTIGDGVHPNAQGVADWTVPIMAGLTFS